MTENIFREMRNIKSTKKELREFGLLVGGIFVLIAAFGLYHQRPWAPAVLVVGAVLVISGALLPKLLLPAHKVWMSIAVVLGAVMSRVVLTVLFFLVLTPVSLLARATGKRFLELGFKEDRTSYWVKRGQEGQAPSDSERQF
ncbi:MAG: hypothetical protein KAR83_06140 [Thermodesulfovibrionales bacterium]|nr:hypothetical protein [Thermodesulfovibrionales bacterium]